MKYLLFVLGIAPSLAQSQWTLDSLQSRARQNYPMIKQFDLISKSTEFTISNANKAHLPQVSVTGIGAYIISGLPTISLPGTEAPEADKTKFIGIGQINQVLWDGGTTKTVKDIAQAAAEVDKANVEVSLYSIRERVNQLFFGVLVIDEQLKNLTIVNETLERNLNRLKLARDNGIAFQTDVDEVRAEILVFEQKKIELNYTRKGYLEMLSLLTAQPLNENAQLLKPEIPGETSLTNQRPELNLFANQTRLVNSQSAMNRAANMPKVGLLGAAILISPGANFATSSISNIALAGLSVSWNTGNIYKTSNNRELDKIQLGRINSQQETFLFNNRIQGQQTNNEIEKQKAVLKNDDDIVALKGNIRKSYQLKYENGLSSMNDLISAVNKESEAMSNRGLHQVQLLMSLYQNKFISGN